MAELVQGSRAIALAGKISLSVLAGLLKEARCVLCVDTFVSHLSAALGAKTVVVFNGVEPVEQWKPWGRDVTIFPIEITAQDLISKIGGSLGQKGKVLSHG